jgi:hypothetical protein
VNLVCSPPLDQLPFLAKLLLPTLLLIRIVILHNFIPYHWFTTTLLTVFLIWSFDMNVTWPHFCSITVSLLLANGRNIEFCLWLENLRYSPGLLPLSFVVYLLHWIIEMVSFPYINKYC